MTKKTNYQEKLLRITEVMKLTGLKKSTIYSGLKNGLFPPTVNISARALAWKKSVIDEWMKNPTKEVQIKLNKNNLIPKTKRKLKTFTLYNLATLSDYWLCLASELESALIEGGAKTNDYRIIDLFNATQHLVKIRFSDSEKSLSFVTSYGESLDD